MEESTLQYALLGILIVMLLVFTWTGSIANDFAEKTVPKIFTPIYCSQANGSLTYALPTSSGYCASLKGDSPDVRFCEFYPVEKKGACRKLLEGMLDRKWDCLTFSLTKETKFDKGSVAIQDACRELTTG